MEADGSSANAKLSVVFANQHTSQFAASPNYLWIVWRIYDCITMLNKSSCGAQSCDSIVFVNYNHLQAIASRAPRLAVRSGLWSVSRGKM